MRRSGLAFVVLLIVAVVVAYLAVSQFRKTDGGIQASGQGAAQQAQELVDTINDRIAQTGKLP